MPSLQPLPCRHSPVSTQLQTCSNPATPVPMPTWKAAHRHHGRADGRHVSASVAHRAARCRHTGRTNCVVNVGEQCRPARLPLAPDSPNSEEGARDADRPTRPVRQGSNRGAANTAASERGHRESAGEEARRGQAHRASFTSGSSRMCVDSDAETRQFFSLFSRIWSTRS
jgi:hypothetical protein